MDIRDAVSADAAAIRNIYAPIVEQTFISFEVIPPTTEEMAKRIEQTSEHYPFLVALQGQDIVGYAYASQHRTRAAYKSSIDVTAYVAEHARHSGVGRALYSELLPRSVARGYHAAFAGIALPNAASVALHEAMGFKTVGIYREVGFKCGRWIDVGWWQKLLNATR